MELKKHQSTTKYDQDDHYKKHLEDLEGFIDENVTDNAQITGKTKFTGGANATWEWGRKSVLTLALTILTSSQGILIAWSKKSGHYDYSVTSANWLVELLKCMISVFALGQMWRRGGLTEDNKINFNWEEIKIYPVPAALYLIKNLLQYYIFIYVDAPSYQILKNLNIISTGILYQLCLSKRLTNTQWVAFALLVLGSTTAQLNSLSTHVLQIPYEGWIIAIMMAFLSGFAGVLSEGIIKKKPSKDINVHNFWLYIFGILFNLIAMLIQEYNSIMSKGLFHGYKAVTMLMVLNHALSGIAVSLVLKHSDNIVKVYSTSIAMFLTAFVAAMFLGFQITIPFCLGSMVVAISVYLHSQGTGGR